MHFRRDGARASTHATSDDGNCRCRRSGACPGWRARGPRAGACYGALRRRAVRLGPVLLPDAGGWHFRGRHRTANARTGRGLQRHVVHVFTGVAAVEVAARCFIVYDEWGGFFDSAPPPCRHRASTSGSELTGQLGIRLPPVARRGFVSHDGSPSSRSSSLHPDRFGLSPLPPGATAHARNIGRSFDWESQAAAPSPGPARPAVLSAPCPLRDGGGGRRPKPHDMSLLLTSGLPGRLAFRLQAEPVPPSATLRKIEAVRDARRARDGAPDQPPAVAATEPRRRSRRGRWRGATAACTKHAYTGSLAQPPGPRTNDRGGGAGAHRRRAARATTSCADRPATTASTARWQRPVDGGDGRYWSSPAPCWSQHRRRRDPAMATTCSTAWPGRPSTAAQAATHHRRPRLQRALRAAPDRHAVAAAHGPGRHRRGRCGRHRRPQRRRGRDRLRRGGRHGDYRLARRTASDPRDGSHTETSPWPAAYACLPCVAAILAR